MGRAYEVRKASIQKTGAARGKIYAMYAKEIYSAAKKSTDLSANPTLKRLVEKAKKEIELLKRNGYDIIFFNHRENDKKVWMCVTKIELLGKTDE